MPDAPPPPLHGRDDILNQARRSFERGGTGLVLVGPPGIGKTRLAQEIVGQIVEQIAPAAAVIRINGSPATVDVPLGAFAPLLPGGMAELALPAILHVREALHERSGGGSVVLAVEDAHLLDEASAALVSQFAAAGDVRLVVTQRSSVAAPDAVVRLWRERLIERIDLGPLDDRATGELAASTLVAVRSSHGDDRRGPVTVDRASARMVWDRSNGNPLYARELVLASYEAGEWEDDPAGWRWNAGLASAPRLDALLADRLAHLSDEERTVLEHLAFGEPLGMGMLQRFAGDRAIDRLEREGLIAAFENRRRFEIRLAHPIYGEVVRRNVSPLRARLIRTSLIDALLDVGARRRDDEMRLATLAIETGFELEVDVVRRAARTALFSHDTTLALRLARQAFDRDGSFASGHALADVLYEIGHFDDITAHWPDWQRAAADDSELAFVAMHQANSHYYRNADAASAFAVLARATADLPPGPPRDEVLGVHATLLTFSGRVNEALPIAMRLLDPDNGPRVLVQAALAATHSLRAMGRCDEAMAINQLATGALEALGGAASLVSAIVFGSGTGTIHLGLGRIEDALTVATASRDAALAAGDRSAEGLAESVRSDALQLLGRIDDAAQAALASDVAFTRANHPAFRWWSICQRAAVATVIGSWSSAERAAADLTVIGDQPIRLFEHASVLASARTMVRDGAVEHAIATLSDASARLQARGEVLGAIACAYEITRSGQRGAAALLAELAADTDGALQLSLAEHARAFDHEDASALGDVAERLWELGARVYAIDAARQATALHRANGDQRAATRWTRQVSLWSTACQPGSVPAEQTVTDGPTEQTVIDAVVSPLSRREREIALLAAEGLASRSIGERLFLSTRTVDNHLARAYDKLGIASRAELAHALAPSPMAIAV